MTIPISSMGDVDVVMDADLTKRTREGLEYTIRAMILQRRRTKRILSETERFAERVVTPASTAGLVVADITLQDDRTFRMALDEERDTTTTHVFDPPLLDQPSPSVTIGWADKSPLARRTR